MTASVDESRAATAAPVWARSASELVADLAAGRLSAVEAVEAHIARIEEVNPVLNAVVWKRYDAARAEAAEADRKRRAGQPLPPLHGLPITVKECLDFEGSPSTFGIVAWRDHVVLAALEALEQAAPAADAPATPVVDVTLRRKSQSSSR